MTRSFDAIAEPMLDQLQQMDVTRPRSRRTSTQVVEMLRPEIELQKQKMINIAARARSRRR